MPIAILCLVGVYRVLLWLYPRELRAGYGGEMTAVFEQMLRSGGVRGVLSASWYAMAEVVTIAVPSRIFSERMIAPSASLTITALLFTGLTALLRDRALADWINYNFLFGCGRH